MSSDIATLLTGRYVEIQMLPLSLWLNFTLVNMKEQQYSLIPAYGRIFVKARSLIHNNWVAKIFDIQEYLRGAL